MIRVLVADDEPSVRQGLHMRLALDPHITCVGEAADGASALAQVGSLHPDVVILDVEMPALDGIAVTRQIRATGTHTAVIMLSIHDDAGTRSRALSAGASAFVSKHDSPDTLLAAIHKTVETQAGQPRVEPRTRL
jgi:two-component system, NarL family, response regulator LiaR